MRDRRYRAWDDGVMVYSDSFKDDRNYGAYDYIRFFFEKIRGDAIVMDYSGIKDRKDQPIYEGDICRFADKYNYYVVFEDTQFICYHVVKDWGRWGPLHRINDHDLLKYPFEVIGNIYENPEFLKVDNS